MEQTSMDRPRDVAFPPRARAEKRVRTEEREDGEIDEESEETKDNDDDEEEAALPRYAKRSRRLILDDENDDDDDATEDEAPPPAGSRSAATRGEDHTDESVVMTTRGRMDSEPGASPRNATQRRVDTRCLEPSASGDRGAAAHERMMELVVDKTLAARQLQMTRALWDQVAQELNDDQLRTGDEVEDCVNRLVEAWWGRSAHESTALSSTLGGLVRKYARMTRRMRPNPTSTAEPNKTPAVPTRKPSIRSGRAASVQASSDELLLELALQHREGLTAVATSMDTWQTVADAMAPKFSQFKSGLVAKSRFERLVAAHNNGDRGRHQVCMTEQIHGLLDKFTEATMRDQTDVLTRIVDQHRPSASISCGPSADDRLLREVLRVRPFHEKLAERAAAWEEVASNTKSATATTGPRCKKRIKALLRIVGAGNTSPGLTTKELIRLRLIDAAMSWYAHGNERLLREYGDLLVKLDSVVEERFSVSSSQVAKTIDTTQLPQDASIGGNTADLEIGCPASRRDSRQESSSQLDQNQDLSLTGTPEMATAVSQRVVETLTVCHEPRMDELVVETVSPRVSHESSAGLNIIERVREEHRAEIKSMFEMIKSEQSAHHRETTAMIALMQQDRVDRHNEFVAMMEFVMRITAKPGRRSNENRG